MAVIVRGVIISTWIKSADCMDSYPRKRLLSKQRVWVWSSQSRPLARAGVRVVRTRYICPARDSVTRETHHSNPGQELTNQSATRARSDRACKAISTNYDSTGSADSPSSHPSVLNPEVAQLEIVRIQSHLTSTRMALIFPDEEPPSYNGSAPSRRSSVLASPSYSRAPDRDEYVIRRETRTSAEPDRYTYSSKSLTLDLGPKIWGTSCPVYGNNATIEGTLTLKGHLKHASAIEVKLEGSVTNTYTERGMVAGCTAVQIATSTTSLPVTSSNGTHTISVPFPSYASGRNSNLPPSAIKYYLGVTCDVKYRLKVSLVKKGFRPNESLKVPLLYLPRTFAKAPLVDFIPDVISEFSSSFLPEPEGVKIIRLNPSCTGSNPPTIAVTLPSSLSFSSYETVPLRVNIVSPTNPAIVKLLQSNISVQLVKRTRTWIQNSKNASASEAVVGIGSVTNIDENVNGVTVTEIDLRAERSAVQKSWAVTGVADQLYFIRVSIRPPSSTACHIPTYDVRIPVEITTDAYDSPEREMVLNGGSSTPAIGTLAVGVYSQGHLSR